MKTVSQLGSGKQPVGTIAYMGRAENLMQSQCTVKKYLTGSGIDSEYDTVAGVTSITRESITKAGAVGLCLLEDLTALVVGDLYVLIET
ncbi:Peroxisomal acyl-coenzyme A oxidase 1 [Bienertia sinuspersici]